MITLTITDNADGTGVTVAITGSASGSTNTLYSVLDVPLGNAPQVPYGPYTGDTSGIILALPVTTASWVWLVNDNSGTITVSTFYRALATNGALAVATRLRAAIVAELGLLVMTGSNTPPNTNIYPRLLENLAMMYYPCVTVATAGEAESEAGTTTGRDDIVYPFRTRIIDSRAQQDDSMRTVYEKWKEQAMRAFRNQPFSKVAGVAVVAESLINRVKPRANQFLQTPGPPGPPGLYVMEFVINCTAREPRGLGA